MCTTCGCGHTHDHHHDHDHQHGHDHPHDHPHDDVKPRRAHDADFGADRAIAVEEDILARNDEVARRNRAYFKAHGIFALNFVSSPGAGKTEFLAATIRKLGGRAKLAVIEGDQQTENDAERIRATGAKALQIQTGEGCHLDASMIVTEDRKVYTWGRNQNAQLGLSGASYVSLARKLLLPTLVELPAGEFPIRGSMGMGCAAVICESGNVFWWGMKSVFPRDSM